MIPELAPLEGKYELLRPLRTGGMGALYLVRHRLLEELRVVKVLRPQLQDQSEFRERFAREARVAIQLRHPHVAQLFDFTLDEAGAAYMVLEYVDGHDLRELIARGALAALGLKVEIACQALSAIGFLHRKGFVHRDISPDNLMLTRTSFGEPSIKLIDLGIVKVLASETGGTSAPGFLGKVRYASPEQFESNRVDARSDLYSFGVLFYELLTGIHPFPGDNMHRMVSGHMFQPPRPFDETDPEGRVPDPLRRLVLEALSKSPEERVPSAEEFVRRLRALALPDDRERWAADLEPIAASAAEARDRVTTESPQREIDRHFGAARSTPSPEAATANDDESRSRLAEALVEAGRPEEAALVLRVGRRPAVEDEATTVRRTRLERRVGDELVSKKLRDWKQYLAEPDEAEPESETEAVGAPPPPAAALVVATARAVDSRVALAVGLAAVLAAGVVAWRWNERDREAATASVAAAPAPPAAAARPLPQPESPPPALPPAPGVLLLDAQPWGRIESVRALASGEAVALPRDGWTPQRLSLPPGRYSIRVSHPEFGARELEAEVVGGGVERRSVRFGATLAESFVGGGGA